MANSIDQRVVQMQFDNKQFESGVQTSLGTLDKLDEKLQFKNTDTNYLQSISSSLESLTERFSVMGTIGHTVLQRITNSVIDSVLPAFQKFNSIISSTTFNWGTFDASFAKYEQMITNQQTIMSSVQGKINEVTGEVYNMTDVTGIIDKLRWYTDETSYNLDQMVGAIGNFTASGIDLKKSESMILGIANACADAGISADKADIAMTGFSKAIGGGGLTLSVWNNQLKTSGITNSEKFRKSLLEAAVEAGTLTKKSEGVYETNIKGMKKQEVTLSDMTETLTKYNWANTEVMQNVLSQYSQTVEGVYQLTSEGKLDIASSAFDDLREAMERQGKTLDELGLDEEYDQASEAIAALTNAYEELGLEVPKSLSAFTRAQEAVSWTQAVEATATAVRSQWASTFELIFGNYEEAKKLWTGVSNSLWGIFAGGGDDRNEILKLWHDNSYEAWANGIIKAFQAIENVIEGFRSILRIVIQEEGEYTEVVADILSNLTDSFASKMENFSNFAEKFALLSDLVYMYENFDYFVNGIGESIEEWAEIKRNNPLDDGRWSKGLDELIEKFGSLEEAMKKMKIVNDVKNTFKGLLAIFDLGKQIVSGFWRATEPLRQVLLDLGLSVLSVTGNFGEWLSNLAWSTKENDTFYNVFKKVVDLIMGVGVPAFELLRKAFEKIKELLAPLKSGFEGFKESFSDIFKGFNEEKASMLERISSAFKKLGEVLGVVAGKIKEAVKVIKTKLNEIFDGFSLDKLSSIVDSGLLGGLLYKLLDFGKGSDSMFGSFKDFLANINGLFSSLGDTLSAFQDKLKAESLVKIATALAILSGSLVLLSTIDKDKSNNARMAMSTLFAELYIAVEKLNKLDFDGKKALKMVSELIGIAASVAILSVAMKSIGSMNWESLIKGAVGIGLIMAELVLASKYMKKINSGGFIGLATSMIIFAGAMKLFGGMDWNTILTGAGAIGILLAEIAVFSVVMEQFGQSALGMIASALAINIIAVSMLEFVGVLKLMSLLSWDEIARGLVAVGVGLAEFAIASAIMGNGHAMLAAAAILVMASALLVLAPALLIFGNMSWEAIGKSLLEIAAVFAIFGVAGALLAPLAPIIITLAGAIALFGIGLDAIAISLSLFAVGLTALGAAVSASGVMIAKGLELIIVTIITAVGKGIVALAMAIGDGAASLVEAGVKLATAFIDAIVNLIPKVVTLGMRLLVGLLTGIRDNMRQITALAIEILVLFIETVASYLGDIIQAGIDLMVAFINGLADGVRNNSEIILNAVSNLMSSIIEFAITALQHLVRMIPVIGGTLADGLEGLKGGVRDALAPQDANAMGKSYTEAASKGTQQGISDNLKGIKESGKSIKNTLFDSLEIDKSKSDMYSGFKGISQSGKDGLMSVNFEPAGKYVDDGFTRGINNNASTAINAAGNVARRALQRAKNELGISSPSKEFAEIGRFSDMGMAEGLLKNSDIAENASEAVANMTLKAFSDPLSQLAEAVSGEIDIDPTITPVLDLSNVKEGSSFISDIFNTGPSLAFAGAAGFNGYSVDGSNPMNSNYAPNINVTINAAPGQSVDELYETFSSRMSTEIKRRNTTWL